MASTTGTELYDHQRLAIEQLSSGKILCARVGVGKSRTALAYFFTKECGGYLPVDGNGEFKPMTKQIPLYIITTAKKRDDMDWEREAVPFGITDQIYVDSWNNIKKYKQIENAFFIFDEQRVVGSGAWVNAFLAIAKKNRWILLTATPGDTWTDYLPVFMANGFYRTRTEFFNRHVVFSPYVKYPKVLRYLDTGRLVRLKEMILVEMEYTKPCVEHHQDILCEYNKEDYDLVSKYRWDPYEEKPIKNISGVCYLLRRICNSDVSRVHAFKKLVHEHPRIIVFYNFDYELDILRRVANELKITHAERNGHKHEEVPSSGDWLYFVQYTAGAEAWNCIETNTMIFYSQSYSYKTMIQAAGRISRMNTPYSDLYYYHLISDSKIDKAIQKCLKNKKQFNEIRYSRKEFSALFEQET